MLKYISTRGQVEPRLFTEILLEGIASDRGLYVPAIYPQLDLKSIPNLNYKSVAYRVLSRLAPDVDSAVLGRVIAETYTPAIFGSPAITPLRQLKHNVHLLGLSNGPTLSFKDIALQLVARLMEHVLAERNEELNILGATSGDTGSAAEEALRGKRGIRVFMLSPFGRMSRFQALQMYTILEKNIINIAVNGTFDDCQRLMKAVSADFDFKKRFKLGAVNSTNWARIAAQVVYYVFAKLQITGFKDEPVSFAVPSGNFGNALSAHVARQMGLPIRDIIVCTNTNDVLAEFFLRGLYRVRKSEEIRSTSSPSMDIGEASNFERIMFDLVKRDASVIRATFGNLSPERAVFFGNERMFGKGIDGIKAGSADEDEVRDAIRIVYKRYGQIIDPHTAVGVHVGLQNRQHAVPLIIAETALPAKFEDAMQAALGFKPEIPEAFRGLEHREQRVIRIDPEPDEVKRIIMEHVS